MEEKKEMRMPVKFNEDSENAVYNDMDTRKEYSPVTFDQPPKDFEDKKYIILYYVVDGDGETEDNRFEICMGRTDCYLRAKEIILENDVDILRSIVLTETEQISRKTNRRAYFMTTVDTSLNLYSFCKKMQAIYNDADIFDIDSIMQERDYNMIGENEEETENDVKDDGSPRNVVEDEIIKLYKEMMSDEYSGRLSFANRDQE